MRRRAGLNAVGKIHVSCPCWGSNSTFRDSCTAGNRVKMRELKVHTPKPEWEINLQQESWLLWRLEYRIL